MCFPPLDFIFILCMIDVLPACMSGDHMCEVSTEVRKGMSGPLELELQLVVSYHVDVGN